MVALNLGSASLITDMWHDRPNVNGFRDELAREHAVAMAQMTRAKPAA